MSIIYLTIDQAIETHAKTVELSGGGLLGRRDTGPLESALFHIQNDDYYPDVCDKLTHLFFSACKFHCFQDGNKRLAIAISAQMLLFNGYLYCVAQFLRGMENISVLVASDHISKELLREIIAACLAGDDDNEELKLKIAVALTKEDN
jgi:death on curing protein